MYVIPLSNTIINWTCAKIISDRLGTPFPLEGGANKGSLSEMCYSGGVVKDGRKAWQLSNFFISFYVEIVDILPLLGGISFFQVKEGAFVLNGSIEAWRQILIEGLSPNSTTETREALGFIFSYIKDAGFASLFDNFKRIPCEDGTFILRG
jgi:hypothetical protein